MDITNSTDPNELFEKFMSCPLKRKLIINLITSEKDNIEEYKKTVDWEKNSDQTSSPLRKIKKKYQCESPTALLRRRALEQNKNSADTQALPKQCFTSSLPGVSSVILKGVVAFVDIKSKDYDRSSGVKALLHSMGATINNQLNKEVTHVIFKDGSFSTYQKANLMNVHLVSVLWIEACRTSGTKVDENKFPALGTEVYDHNVSALCSQLQKEYKEIVKEELCRSLLTGSPLPSTRKLIDKRRTIMTPNISSSSYAGQKLSQEFPALQDRKIAGNSSAPKYSNNFASLDKSFSKFSSMSTHEEGSDLEACIAGQIIQKEIVSFSGSRYDITDDESTEHGDCNSASESHRSLVDSYTGELNNTHNLKLHDKTELSSKENSSPNTPNAFYTKNTPKINRSKESRGIPTDKRYENLSHLHDSLSKRWTRSGGKNIDSITLLPTGANNVSLSKISTFLPEPASKGSSSKVDLVSSSNANKKVETSFRTNNSPGVNNIEKSISTNMSTLQLSNSNMDNSANKNMAQLQIDSATNENLRGFNSNNNSFSPIQPSVMNNIIQLLDTSSQSIDNVTRRRKRNTVSKLIPNRCENDDCSLDSDNSEVLVTINSKNCTKKSFARKRIKNSACTGENESEKTQQGNLLSTDTDTKIHEKTELVAESMIDANESSVTDNVSTKLDQIQIGKDLFLNNGNEADKNSRLGLLTVDAVHTSSNDQSSNKRKKSMNGIARKLYDPYDYSQDYFLRGHRPLENSEGVAEISNDSAKPKVILSHRAKKFVEKHDINVDKILHEHSANLDGKNSKLPKKKIPVHDNVTSGEDKKQLKVILDKKCADKNFQNVRIVSNKEDVDCVNKRCDEVGMKKICSTSSFKKPRKMRHSEAEDQIPQRRYSQRLIKHSNKGCIDISNPVEKTDPDILLQNRRSTQEFQTKVNLKKIAKVDKVKQPSIVCTKMHKDEIMVFNQIVKKLGGFLIEDEITRKSTHLVAGEPRRTINMLRAIATGCWIVSREWLFQSLEAGKWLPEEDFELTDFSPAVEQCRLQRQAFGASYSMDIFQDCGTIYIAKGSTPRCSDLRDLVTLCKGKCTTIARNSKIVVGEVFRYDGVTCVKENWILDSIAFNKKMPLKNYIISSNRTSDDF